MDAVEFKEQNLVFRKPNDMTDKQCRSLPVYKGKTDEGYPIIVSCWKLSEEDLEEVKKSGLIYLSMLSEGIQPVALSVASPFKE